MADTYADTGLVFSEYDKARVYPISMPEAVVRGSFFAAKSKAESERQGEAKDRLDAYEDAFAHVLRRRISQSYEAPNANELIKVLDTTNNPLKRIVNEVSVLYTKPPVRKLADPGATALWRDVLRGANASVVFPRLNRLVNLLNTVLVYVRPCHDSLTLRLILPQDVTVIPDPDDPTMPLFVEFGECDPAAPNSEPTYHQWDRRNGSEGYRKYDVKGRLVASLVNPYKDWTGRTIIPIVAFHREWPTWSFWDQTSGRDLYELTLMIGMWETWINHLIRTDSFQQKWATGEIDSLGEQVGGTNSIMQVRAVSERSPVTIGQFSSQSDWDGLGAQIRRKYENVLNNVGLVLPDTRTSGDPTSGYALTIRSQGLIKIQKSQIPSYEKSEESFYRVGSAVWNFERTNSMFPGIQGPPLPPPPVARPSIQYSDVSTVKSAEELSAELDRAERRIAMGVASPVTVYIEMHPEATEEEAREAILKNRADTEALKDAPKPEPPPMVPDVPSEVGGGEGDSVEDGGGEPPEE